jgi:hypothetical protein
LAKRTVTEVIEDWVFSVWKQELPRTFQARREAFYRLFDTLKEEGYGWNDVGGIEDRYIKSFTVGNKGTGQQKKEWNEWADKHILDAKIHSFGTRGKIAGAREVENTAPPEGEKTDAPAQETESRSPKLKDYVPNSKALDDIDKMFKFDFTDEDIE